eukprot:310523-Chlamydomonas_euryale.AAC.1
MHDIPAAGHVRAGRCRRDHGAAGGLDGHGRQHHGVALCARHRGRGRKGGTVAAAVFRHARRVARVPAAVAVPGDHLCGARHPAAAAIRGKGVLGGGPPVQGVCASASAACLPSVLGCLSSQSSR